MDWGNAIARTIVRDDAGRVTEIRGELHLEGDFKKTKKKLTWLSAYGSGRSGVCGVTAHRTHAPAPFYGRCAAPRQPCAAAQGRADGL